MPGEEAKHLLPTLSMTAYIYIKQISTRWTGQSKVLYVHKLLVQCDLVIKYVFVKMRLVSLLLNNFIKPFRNYKRRTQWLKSDEQYCLKSIMIGKQHQKWEKGLYLKWVS